MDRKGKLSSDRMFQVIVLGGVALVGVSALPLAAGCGGAISSGAPADGGAEKGDAGFPSETATAIDSGFPTEGPAIQDSGFPQETAPPPVDSGFPTEGPAQIDSGFQFDSGFPNEGPAQIDSGFPQETAQILDSGITPDAEADSAFPSEGPPPELIDSGSDQ